MTTTKKLSETGWFYHAPAKPVPKTEPVPVPPASQIPGLSDLSAEPPEPERRTNILESDSPYIRMAKMGGRPDLLRFREPKPPSHEPKPYPRNDWFYQDDIALEENSKKKPVSDYVFTLPNYMVHSTPKSKTRDEPENYTPNRLPYAFDKTTVYEREGDNLRDHTVAIEESRPHGYGVRAEKQHGKPVKMKNMPAPEKGKAPPSQFDDGVPKVKPMKEMKEEDRPPMGKILSFGYAKDWEEERDKWEASQAKNTDKKKANTRKTTKSEYQSSMAAKAQPARSANSRQRLSADSKKKAEVEDIEDPKQKERELSSANNAESVQGTSNNNNNVNNNAPSAPDNTMSSSAPFATAASAIGEDPHKGGRRRVEGANQRQDAPFATNYPEQSDVGFRDEGTPSKHVGRRRYEAQDARHEAPFATASGEPMFQSPPAESEAPPAVNNTPSAGETGRQKPIKPSDNSDVFRYDGSNAGGADAAPRAGRRRFQQEKHDAPFATFGGQDDRNGTSAGSTETPRSAGGRRRFEDKLAKKPAPFALDDGERFKNASSHANTKASNGANSSAGARKQDRNVPPPNSTGEGQANRSQMRDCPFALN